MIRRFDRYAVRTLRAPLCAAALAALPSIVTAAAPRQAAEKPVAIELGAAKPAEVAGLEIEVSDPRRPRPSRRAVTDIAVILLPGRLDLDVAMGAAGGVGTAAGRRLFRARIAVVAEGRIVRAPLAWCGGFAGGFARCEADCDGGSFALRREAGRDRALRLLLGELVAGAVDDGAGGLVLTACQVDGGEALRLVPRRGASAGVSLGQD
jgi:hypothetical protein